MGKVVSQFGRIVACSAAYLLAFVAWGDVFVDCNSQTGSDTDPAAGTEAIPFLSIQAAVDKAASGETIRIAAGDYSNGVSTVNSSLTRVLIDGKKLHLIGAGRGKTVVWGKQADTASGLGEGAMRCFAVVGSGSVGTIIEKMTLTKGGTEYGTANTDPVRGGGWFADRKAVYFVDCDVAACAARDGASAWYGTAIRCRFLDNIAPIGTGGSRWTDMLHCVIARCETGPSTGLAHYGTFVNCTFLQCDASYVLCNNAKGYNCLSIQCAGTLAGSGCSSESCIQSQTATKGDCQLYSAIDDTFRLLAGSDAVGAGDPANLTQITLPDGISANVDLWGKSVTADSSGKIRAGASQTVRTPTTGGLWLQREVSNGCQGFEIDGKRIDGYNLYIFPEQYPTQFAVKPVMSTGKYFYRYVRNNTDYFADMNGVAWLMPPPGAGVIATNVFQGATAVRWVGGTNASDDNDGKSASAPKATIKAAIDSAKGQSRTCVYVAPGTYGTTFYTNDTYGVSRFCVSQQMLIKGTGGAGVTFIKGAADPDTLDDAKYPGCGPKAVRCVFSTGTTAFALQGFTLQDGHTVANSDDFTKQLKSGAAFFAYNTVSVLDCVITNCVGARSIVEGANLYRSRVLDCVSSNETFITGMASSCYFRNNTVRYVGPWSTGVLAVPAYHCTLVGTPRSGLLNGGTAFYNAIEDGGGNVYSATSGSGLLLYNYQTNYAKDENVEALQLNVNPYFVDRAKDAVLYSFSTAVAGGVCPTASNYGSHYWSCVTSDLEGNRIAFSADGKPTLGAVMRTVKAVTVEITAPAKGGLEIVKGQTGTSYLAEGDEVAFAPATGTRPCAGIKLNDATICFTNYPGETIRLGYADIERLGGLGRIEAWYTTDWYVAGNGDDTNTGFLPTRPKRRLSSVAALWQAKDTIWAAPGTYDDGTCAIAGTSETTARVYIPRYNAVRALGSPTNTIIKGGACVRPVYMERDTTVSGFTLTGARLNESASASAADYMGAAVLSNQEQGRHPNFGIVVENCIISNNVSAEGGAVSRCMLVNCRVTDNVSTGTTSAATIYQGSAYGCYIDRNVAQAVFNYSAHVMDCIIGPDNKRPNGNASAGFTMPGFSPDTKSRIYNSLFASELWPSQGGCVVSNCVANIEGSGWPKDIIYDRVIWTNAENLVLTPEGVPVVGQNVAVDRGDLSLNTYFPAGAKDARGFQRVMNGSPDIGCYEADWRARYADDLGMSRRIDVKAVDPSVVETAEKSVCVSNAAVTVVWKVANVGDRGSIRFRVTGGTLSVTQNGTELGPFAAAAGLQSVSFTAQTENDTFVFRHATDGAGAAELVNLKAEIGFRIMIQ